MPGELGAVWLDGNQCRFQVWAPHSGEVHLHIVAPQDRVISMEPKQRGYHSALVDGIEPGTRYLYRLDNGKELPDPASRYQPEGVHGPSQVVPRRFEWYDGHWFGLPIESYVI